jgi:hypothetical protein
VYTTTTTNSSSSWWEGIILKAPNYSNNRASKTNKNQKPGKLKEERNSKPQSLYTLKTYTFLLLLLQNVNTNTHSNTYTHINKTENSQQNML